MLCFIVEPFLRFSHLSYFFFSAIFFFHKRSFSRIISRDPDIIAKSSTYRSSHRQPVLNSRESASNTIMNTLREKCPNTGKYGPEVTPYLDTFHAVNRSSGFNTEPW